MAKEQLTQAAIRAQLGARPDVRLYRNQVGEAHYVDDHGKDRHVIYGLCRGSSDLIGWRTVEITPDMVGQKIAQFVAIEVKGPRTKVTDEQKMFIANVQRMGGRAGVARSVDEAEEVVGSTKLLIGNPTTPGTYFDRAFRDLKGTR